MSQLCKLYQKQASKADHMLMIGYPTQYGGDCQIGISETYNSIDNSSFVNTAIRGLHEELGLSTSILTQLDLHSWKDSKKCGWTFFEARASQLRVNPVPAKFTEKTRDQRKKKVSVIITGTKDEIIDLMNRIDSKFSHDKIVYLVSISFAEIQAIANYCEQHKLCGNFVWPISTSDFARNAAYAPAKNAESVDLSFCHEVWTELSFCHKVRTELSISCPSSPAINSIIGKLQSSSSSSSSTYLPTSSSFTFGLGFGIGSELANLMSTGADFSSNSSDSDFTNFTLGSL
jgi:hypothetical protein